MPNTTKAALCLAVLAATPGQAQAPDWAGAQPVTIQLSSFKFNPAVTTLHHGTAYRLHLENSSSGGHDFVAKELFAKSLIAPSDGAKIHSGGIDVDGKESVDVRFMPQQPGTYKIHCSHFMHSTFGMKGQIVVD